MLALRRLAQLDGARLPEGELLVAEAEGEIRAALRISDSAYVADPFFPSRELVGPPRHPREARPPRERLARSTAPARAFRSGAALYQRASESRLML